MRTESFLPSCLSNKYIRGKYATNKLFHLVDLWLSTQFADVKQKEENLKQFRRKFRSQNWLQMKKI